MRQEHTVRYVVLGAGPAGLQMVYFLRRAGVEHVVLERSSRVGSFFRDLPRSRTLISFNKVHSLFEDPEIRLRWDWNSLLTDDYGFPFRDFSRRLYPWADELVAYLEGFREAYDLEVRHDTEVVRVTRHDDGEGGWRLETAGGDAWRCRVLVVATGFGRPYVPPIPGIEHAVGYEAAPFDPDAYAGERVLILGKGNSAMEVAEVALEAAAVVHVASPRPLTMAWASRHPGHIRSNHARLLDAYHLKTLNSLLNCEVVEIEPLAAGGGGPYKVTVAYTRADGEVDELFYDRVVRCTGFAFDGSAFDPAPDTVLDGRLPAITPYWESPSHPDLYFAGTLMQGRDFKRSSSAFIDGFRYNVRTLHRHLMERYEERPFPRRSLAAGSDRLAAAVLERLCRTSGLWTQFGYLCDVLVVADGERLEWLEELPLESIREGALADHPHYYTLTFEWGRWEGDPMAVERHPSAEQAHRSVFLHPVVRRYRHGRAVDTHHVLEDLYGVYASDRERGAVRSHGGLDMAAYHRCHHEAPLEAFFHRHFGAPAEVGG